MELERFQLALRRRSPFEAADLGLALVRRWRGAVYRAWFATFVPFALLLFLACWEYPLIAGIAGWWLKPLFDRLLLKVYAEAVFDEPPGVRAVWRALPGLIRQSGLLRSLTLGRGDMARSFHLPVTQLERQQGSAAAARRRVLDRRTRGCAVWLTFSCIHFSVFLQISLVLLLQFLWPTEAEMPLDWKSVVLGESETGEAFLSHLSWILGETLVEPFYVAAGFTLYLNRRNDLEGWDIEQGFRRLARRIEAGSRPAAGRRAALLATLSLSGLLLAQLPAEVRAAPASPASAARQTIDTVLADPVFGREVRDWTWRYRGDDEKEAPFAPGEALGELAHWIGEGIRILAYAGLILLAAGLSVLLYRHRESLRIRRSPPRKGPATLFGLDLRPASLPADVALAAAQALQAGNAALALSLLYRGALAALIHRAGVEFRPGDTEGDCRARVRGRIDGDSERYFSELLAAWMLVAYADTLPATDSLRDLCARWPRHFGRP